MLKRVQRCVHRLHLCEDGDYAMRNESTNDRRPTTTVGRRRPRTDDNRGLTTAAGRRRPRADDDHGLMNTARRQQLRYSDESDDGAMSRRRWAYDRRRTSTAGQPWTWRVWPGNNAKARLGRWRWLADSNCPVQVTESLPTARADGRHGRETRVLSLENRVGPDPV
jgi:hypothetical protein